jgi:alpha-tubulin suppressor-like RCC1 family protein
MFAAAHRCVPADRRATLWNVRLAVVLVAGVVAGCGRIGFHPEDGDGFGTQIGIAAGDRFSCALRPDHTVWCWGDGRFGQLGDGSQVPRPGAGQVSGLANAVQIDAGAEHACARLDDGSILC